MILAGQVFMTRVISGSRSRSSPASSHSTRKPRSLGQSFSGVDARSFRRAEGILVRAPFSGVVPGIADSAVLGVAMGSSKKLGARGTVENERGGCDSGLA